MNEVAKGIWLGSLKAANNTAMLKQKGITHILTVIHGFHVQNTDQFITKRFELLDHPEASLAPHFDECAEFIKEGR
jgi:hypothetical protein